MRLSRFAVAGVLGTFAMLGETRAEAAECDQSSWTCAVGTAPLTGSITKRLGTEIDSGEMTKKFLGIPVSIRTRFTIEPVGTAPLLKVDMPAGALVEATWPEKGFVSIRALTKDAIEGSLDVRYQLVPSLEGKIAGIGINRNASQLLDQVGGSFDYDESGRAPIRPWGFDGAQVATHAPPLSESTLFSIPFSALGIPSIDGSLAVQASASPVFAYRTKEVRFDAGSATRDVAAKIPVGDADFLDINAQVVGDLQVRGNVDIGPAVRIYGVDIGLAVVSKSIDGMPEPVTFQSARIHIPLPNVKVPTTPIGFGEVKSGASKERTVAIASTGELGGILSITSSNPQFSVPREAVRVDPRSEYPLKVVFRPNGDGSASATITVRSNDPGEPEQTFKVGANGADVGDEDVSDKASAASEESTGGGCSVASPADASSAGFVGLALGLSLLARRRRP